MHLWFEENWEGPGLRPVLWLQLGALARVLVRVLGLSTCVHIWKCLQHLYTVSV